MIWTAPPDTTALREMTGWVPTRTIDDAIDDVIAHEQGRWDVPRRTAVAS